MALGVPDLSTLTVPLNPACGGRSGEYAGPFPLLQAITQPVLVALKKAEQGKKIPPGLQKKIDQYEEGAPYIPPPTVPGGQGSTASEEGPGTGGTDPPPEPPVVHESPLETLTTLEAAPNPALVGQSVTLTAEVLGSGNTHGEGAVEFFDGMVSLGSEPLVEGVAELAVPDFTAGTHTLVAVFTPSDPEVFEESESESVALEMEEPPPPSGGGGADLLLRRRRRRRGRR